MLRQIIIALIFCTPYVVNVYKFLNCDFEGDYRCEAIHGAGVIVPPIAFVTFWFDDGEA